MAREFNLTESKVTLVERNDRGDYVRVCRLTPQDSKQLQAVDIRNYYTSNEDGKMYPTQKGVRLHGEMVVETVVAILEALSVEEYNRVIDIISEEGAS